MTTLELKQNLLNANWEITENTNLKETHIQCFLDGGFINAEFVCVSGGMFGCGITTKIPSAGFEHLFNESKWFNIEL